MSELVIKACVVFSLGIIAAQMYDDAYDTYGNDYVDYDDGEEEDYSDDYYVNISFTPEKFEEFYTCLCVGQHEECRLHYTEDGSTWNISLAEGRGELSTGHSDCKYYSCALVRDSQRIACVQKPHRPCENRYITQFFRRTTQSCLSSPCVGIFWQSVEEHLTFEQNSSGVENCEFQCSCGPGDEEPEAVTLSSAPPSTQKDSNHEHKTPPLSSRPELADENESLRVANMSNSGVSNNDRFKKIITISIAVLLAISLALCILCLVIFCLRKRRTRMKATINSSPTTETGNNSISNTGPQLLYMTKAKGSESSPKRYSNFEKGSTVPASKNGTEKSPIKSQIGSRKVDNFKKAEDNSENNMSTEIIHLQAEPKIRTPPGGKQKPVGKKAESVAKYNSSISNRYPDNLRATLATNSSKFSEGGDSCEGQRLLISDLDSKDFKTSEELECRQPLINFPKVKESVV